MKKTLVLIVFIILLLLSPFVACTPATGAWRDIRFEAAETFIKMGEKGINETGLDMERIESNLYELALQSTKLDQVLVPSLNWVESQKKTEHKAVAWIKKTVSPEGLSKLQNDYYKVTELVLLATQNETGTAWNFSTSIKINDLKSNVLYDPVVLKDNLDTMKNSLEKQRKTTLDAITFAKIVLKSSVENLRSWEVRRASSIYVFSGLGLGWVAGKLDRGQWTYQYTNRELSPVDDASRALKIIITTR
jgi:hypothetical protein